MVERLKVRLMGMVVWMVGGDTILKTFAKIWRFCLVERLKVESWVDWVGCMDGVDAILKAFVTTMWEIELDSGMDVWL